MRRDDARRNAKRSMPNARVSSPCAPFRDLAYDTSQNDTSLPENARRHKKASPPPRAPWDRRRPSRATATPRGAFSGRRGVRSTLRAWEEFQEFGGACLTRDTMLDEAGGGPRAVADETNKGRILVVTFRRIERVLAMTCHQEPKKRAKKRQFFRVAMFVPPSSREDARRDARAHTCMWWCTVASGTPFS